MHKLALRMGRTVRELEGVMSTRELASWFAFDRLSPIGDERLDYLFAAHALATCSAAGAKPKRGGAFKLEDFMLFKLFARDPEPMTFMRSILPSVVKGKRPRVKE